MKRSINILDWATPLGRDAKGRFVSLKNVKVAAVEAAASPKVVFVSAKYGSDEKRIDIASKLSDKSIGRKITNALAGEDPCPKLKKSLIVTVNIDGKESTKTFNEGEKLTF